MPDSVLIAGLSGRALAAAARRAGYRPLVADLFQDLDTKRLAERCLVLPGDLAAGIEDDHVFTALADLAAKAGDKPVGFVPGAGFEDRPQLLARIGRCFPLLATAPERQAQIKDPRRFTVLLDLLGIPHPEVTFRPPADPRGWLVKHAAASGGGHVRPARADDGPAERRYFQRRVAGRPVSALFLADGARAVTLGFSEQWRCSGGPRSPFRFGGAVQPAAVTRAMAARLDRAIRKVSAVAGLRGLCSADFLLRRGNYHLLEINPRPGATLDIFDLGQDAPLFALHHAACQGHLPQAWHPPRHAAACTIVYARKGVTVPIGHRWPRWTADRPAPGSVIAKGEPLCTVLARGNHGAEARNQVLDRAARVLASLEPRGRRDREDRTAEPAPAQL